MSKNVDAGIVRTPAAVAPGLALADRDLQPGDDVLVAGFPFGGALRVVAATVADVVDGTPRGSVGPVLRLNTRLVRGMSGGPVLDAAGRVAAIVFAVEESGHTLAIPASTLHDLVLTAPGRCG